MKYLLALALLTLCSCAKDSVAERRPVPPPGSDAGSMPWNIPGKNSGQGALGGFGEGR